MGKHSFRSKSDRRRAIRQACRLRIPCSIKRIVQEGPWRVVVRGVSAEHLIIACTVPFQIGIHLSIELPHIPKQQVIRIAHLKTLTPGKEWEATGIFSKKMKDVELRAFHSNNRPAKLRKTDVRPRLSVPARCHLIRVREEGPWLVTLQNISDRGLGFVTDHRIEPGTFIKVELPSVRRKHLHPKLVRVTRALPDHDGWLLGGVFVQQLTDAEVSAML